MLLDNTKADVEEADKKKWVEKTEKQEFLKIALPYGALILLTIFHVVYGFLV